MALCISNTVIQTRRDDRGLCTDVSLITSGVDHRLHGFGRGHGSHGRNGLNGAARTCLGRTPIAGIARILGGTRPRLPRRIVQTGCFTVPPVAMTRTLRRLVLVSRSFCVFLGTRAGRVGIVCRHGRNNCNLVRPHRPGNGRITTGRLSTATSWGHRKSAINVAWHRDGHEIDDTRRPRVGTLGP